MQYLAGNFSIAALYQLSPTQFSIIIISNNYLCTLACLHVQKRSGLFGGPAFIQPIRAIWKSFKRSYWLDKSHSLFKYVLYGLCVRKTNSHQNSLKQLRSSNYKLVRGFAPRLEGCWSGGSSQGRRHKNFQGGNRKNKTEK